MIRVREEYIARIKRELMGPGSEISIPDENHEHISASPTDRYSIGILYPKNEKIGLDTDDLQETQDDANADNEIGSEDVLPHEKERMRYKAVGDSEDDTLDEQIGLAQQNKPSSMGLSFFVQGNADVVNCTVELAKYRKANTKECIVPSALIKGFPDDFLPTRIPDSLLRYISYDEDEKVFSLKDKIESCNINNIIDNADATKDDKEWLKDVLFSLCTQYIRIPLKSNVCVSFSSVDYLNNTITLSGDSGEQFECCLAARRIHIKDDIWSITLMLVNNAIKKKDARASYSECIFQPRISVKSCDNGFKFTDFTAASNDTTLSDEEDISNQLLYRNKKTYASGHGVSVGWESTDSACKEIYTDFFPICEVPQMDFSMNESKSITYKNGKSFVMLMKDLSDLSKHSKEECLDGLACFLEDYKQWIDSLKNNNSDIYSSSNELLKNAADENIDRCRESHRRMIEGLTILRENDTAWKAFRLANRAMYMQRIHIVLQELTSREKRFDGDSVLDYFAIDYCNAEKTMEAAYKEFTDGDVFRDPSWRPFQLAFLLLSIKSIVLDGFSDNNQDRDIVDLIWFPTGGGKTEAYLGLTAFTIFYRRLIHKEDYFGTTVIMRYTLRLLTSQQFTRASTLICACEYIRSNDNKNYPHYDLGDERISIGLWIGSSHTPNENNVSGFDPSKDDYAPGAKQCVEQLNDAKPANIDYKKERYNKFQVLKCPWCGAEMTKSIVEKKLKGSWGYQYSKARGFYMACTNQDCYFCDDHTLPIQVVDEELYNNPPSLLFSTVDKFAMIPFKEEISRFFGLRSGQKVSRPPELIIQDELHLISGPLGTIVAQYETAFDYLCSKFGNRYKIIASTATIRRAKQQCYALYNRKVSQFPSPGLTSEDSYFAKEKEISYSEGKYGRVYVGLMPSGKTKATMEVRTISSMMQLIKEMNIGEDVRDKYWTLTAYFGSLRDLGKAHTLVEDDIAAAVGHIAKRHNSEKRYIGLPDELTSRVTTTELNETLNKLEKVRYSDSHKSGEEWPSNILLATNMISVGIDVARLNVMILVGQPKLTSEYIQASSRIGRSYPGVAFALYDSGKSRDRSHFEQFKSYHNSFYRFVEPTGVTPFSKPARERALHSLVVAMLRHSDKELAGKDSAGMLNHHDYTDLIEDIKDYITRRNRAIIENNNPNMVDNTKDIIGEIESFIQEWRDRISEPQGILSYGNAYPSSKTDDGKLLKPYGVGRYRSGRETMTSMRNVDESIPAHIVIWEKDAND